MNFPPETPRDVYAVLAILAAIMATITAVLYATVHLRRNTGATNRPSAEVTAARKEFTQWPPPPDEVDNSKLSLSTTEKHKIMRKLWEESLFIAGAEWLIDHKVLHGAVQTSYIEFFQNLYGWPDTDIATWTSDQFFVARAVLKGMVEHGIWPPVPTPPEVDMDALDRQQQADVAKVNTPWQPPDQPQHPQPPLPPIPPLGGVF